MQAARTLWIIFTCIWKKSIMISRDCYFSGIAQHRLMHMVGSESGRWNVGSKIWIIFHLLSFPSLISREDKLTIRKHQWSCKSISKWLISSQLNGWWSILCTNSIIGQKEVLCPDFTLNPPQTKQGVIKGPWGTSALLAHSDDSHQPLTQSWNTISSWISPNQWEIYHIKPHFDQIGTVNVSQRLWSLTAVVFGFWKNQAGGWWESSEWDSRALVPPVLLTPPWTKGRRRYLTG